MSLLFFLLKTGYFTTNFLEQMRLHLRPRWLQVSFFKELETHRRTGPLNMRFSEPIVIMVLMKDLSELGPLFCKLSRIFSPLFLLENPLLLQYLSLLFSVSFGLELVDPPSVEEEPFLSDSDFLILDLAQVVVLGRDVGRVLVEG